MDSEAVAVPVKNTGDVGTASPPIEAPKEVQDKSSVEPTPSIDSNYIAKYYSIDNVWSDLSPDLQEAGETIMEYYRNQVSSKRRVDSKESFGDFMKHLERSTDTKHAPPETKLKVISEFIRYLTKVQPYK